VIVGIIFGFNSKEPVLGIVGGFGPETTAEFFSKVLALSKIKKFRPKIIIVNAAVSELLEKQGIKEDVRPLLPVVADCIHRLNAADADFIVIPCNTLHLLIDELRALSKKPILSIVDVAVSELKNKCVSNVGLLGTTTTIKSCMFQNAFAKAGIDTLIPTENEQNMILSAIENVLQTGIAQKSDVTKVKQVIKNLKERGVQCILLACTDLQLLVSGEECVFDTLDLLAKASVNNLIKANANSC